LSTFFTPARRRLKPPIFILGVPRSGTTLLRAILDSHSAIACGPETPWLGGHQPRSLHSLWRALRDEPWGYCQSYNMPRDIPTLAARDFLNTLMSRYASARAKKRWAEKTPDNALYVDFLLELFPDARFIHLTRDGLDVAMSTSIVAPHRKGISDFLESKIGFGPDAPAVPNTPFAALLRWRHWNNLITRSLAGRDYFTLSYERLVAGPEPAIRELTDFIDEPFEPSMLDYARTTHDYPSWEWGSADVQAHDKITPNRTGRAKRELPSDMHLLLAPLARAETNAPAAEHSAERHPPEPLLRDVINSFSAAIGLDTLADATPIARHWPRLAGPWLGKTIHFRGPSSHPLPWLLALQGAAITIDHPLPPSLSTLAQGLRVTISSEAIAAPHATISLAPNSLDATFTTADSPLS
jgi:protein-tyrosine sulfotransferase